jgi:hypothetical protein
MLWRFPDEHEKQALRGAQDDNIEGEDQSMRTPHLPWHGDEFNLAIPAGSSRASPHSPAGIIISANNYAGD